jgi:hypothetical protein
MKGLVLEMKLLRRGVAEPLDLWCDNKSAINIANNPVQHDRMKHVQIDQYLSHVTSGEQIADCFDK